MNDTPAERDGESTWARLRRRKVVQWGIAYVAGAWALLQVLEYFGGTFHWLEQIQQLTTLALLIGPSQGEISLSKYQWQPHCRGLYQLPVAA